MSFYYFFSITQKVKIFFFHILKKKKLGTEWFVSNSTINGNGTETNPFNSINEAIQKSSEYDIITVLPGIYVGIIFLCHKIFILLFKGNS